jgi:hypothetical protein
MSPLSSVLADMRTNSRSDHKRVWPAFLYPVNQSVPYPTFLHSIVPTYHGCGSWRRFLTGR